MDFIIDLFLQAARQTAVALAHNWPFLLASILVAGALAAFVDARGVAAFLRRHRGTSVLAATAAAVTTPFCSCGTTAVLLGMMAGAMPLAPIVAFMVASPLSSPQELVYSAGLFGWPFALAYFAASILLGLAGGGLAGVLEKRGFLRGQTRYAAASEADTEAAPACGCGESAPVAAPACGCGEKRAAPPTISIGQRVLSLLRSSATVAKRIVPMFIGFGFIGALLNALIPPSWIETLFGSGKAYGVPLAATIGLPLYISSEASLPLVRALLDSGMSRGAMMAFLIAGSGTSIGAITGALTIARWKVVGLVVAVLWIGAMLAGYGFDLLAAAALA
jgi:uncharacterized membrane protein YraQ (UPF0718 family)